MGDALCGPSNALQNFQKNAAVDRTLQQDRLISRKSPAQGFRSQSPRDGILDPEFAAFEANHGVPANLPDLQHPAHFGPSTQHGHPGPNWTSDFQNLHISGPAPPQLHGPSFAPAQSEWQNEFMSQQQHQQPAAANPVQVQQSANRTFQPAFAPSYPMYNATMNMQQLPQQAPAMNVAPTEQFDESAFEAAFEQARVDMEKAQEKEINVETESLAHEEVTQLDPVVQEYDEIRIGSDTISPQGQQAEPLTQANDADLLVQTAAKLLDSVRHETDQKFQQSNFLELVRRIRDREVQVEGDELRETAQSLHPGGRYYPGQSPEPIISPDKTSKESIFSTVPATPHAV
ncbi:hypothetical protein F1880_003527 [Penicillium rolfsii]|nr:hypothetical protein F1880_003527 [Penicillium rolfsii]